MPSSQIRAIAEHTGPFATVVVPTPSATHDADNRRRIQAGSTVSRLEEAGVPAKVVERVNRALSTHLAGEWTAVVASPDNVVIRGFDDAPREIVVGGPLPHLLPFIEDDFDNRAHVLIVADRTGAEIIAATREGDIEGTTVNGDEQHVQKVSAGGWSQRRMQNHSEHTWEQNAQDIVAVAVRHAESVDAELIVVAGDLRAIQLVEEHVPEQWQDRLVTHPTEPTDPADWERLAEEVTHLVADVAAREKVALLERFGEARGQGADATEGASSVLAALRRSQVDTLLIGGHDVDEQAWFVPGEPTLVAADAGELSDLELDAEPQSGPLVDVAVRAAIATGAEVVVVPEHGRNSPGAPIAALLRFETPDV